jgi:glycerol-3-phosphate dehydrogenase (NAD(P)+)
VKVGVVGAGAWGTALALVAHRNGHSVTLWGHNPDHLRAMAAVGVNERYLPGFPLPDGLILETDLDRATLGAELLILAVPSTAFRGIAARLQHVDTVAVSVTKGIECHSGLTMSGIIADAMPKAAPAALSGPSLALEVAREIPTAVVAAASTTIVACQVQSALHRPSFRIYSSTDLAGVELGGALKNVIAIAAGVCDGLGFGDNSKAALVTRGRAEMTRLAVTCGADPATLSGLSGLGDLTVTCFSKLSRNRSFGERIGRGATVEQLLAASPSAVEGYPTTRSAYELAQKRGVACPIIAQVHAMLYEGKDPRRAVSDLLDRDPKPED